MMIDYCRQILILILWATNVNISEVGPYEKEDNEKAGICLIDISRINSKNALKIGYEVHLMYKIKFRNSTLKKNASFINETILKCIEIFFFIRSFVS